MGNAHTDGRTDGAAGKKLSGKQIAALIKIARQAYSQQQFVGAIEEKLSFDDWRHRVTMQVVERPGFSACHNEDYLPLKSHFLRVLGMDDEAAALEARAEIEPRTWAIKGLQDACTAAADVMPRAMDYAKGYLKHFGADLENATTNQLFRAMYCVQRRVKQLRAKKDEPAKRANVREGEAA